MKNIFERIKVFLKDNYKGIIFLIIIYIVFNLKLGFSIYSPGGLINLTDRITSSDKLYSSKGTINMTYVSLVKGTPATFLLSKIIPSWDMVDNSDITYDGDIDETIKIDKYYLKESISNAYKVAYNAANIDYTITNSNNYITYISDDAETDLKLFDNIRKYDNIEFTTFKSMQDYITSKNVGDKIDFIVLRNNKEVNCYAELIEINGVAKVGVSAVVINEYDSNVNIDIKVGSSESGSSGGFLMTLAIYNALTEYDITKGRVISGTGTIDEEGNVGIIGGVTYKLKGAVNNNADVFLVPSDNYDEALKYKKQHKLDIELVSISNFSEAINYLLEED